MGRETSQEETVSQNLSKEDSPKAESHKERLRALLAPLPRHIVGPVPTYSTEEEEVSEEPPAEFSCPEEGAGISRHGRRWRAYPDPGSCRHYYICVEDMPAVRHGCGRGRGFDENTQTCQGSHGHCSDAQDTIEDSHAKEAIEKNQKHKSEENSGDKQGLFVEFIQFLIKIGMFNKNIVRSMLSNKHIFM